MDDATHLLKDTLGLRRPKGDRWRGALIGDFEGNTDAPLAGWKYVRIPVAGSGDYALGMFPGQNVVGTEYNTPVIIEYDPLNNQRIIVGADVQTVGATISGPTIIDPGGYAVAVHAWTHKLGGGDQIDVANEQLTNLQLRPSATNTKHVTVKGGVYTVGGVLIKLQTDVEVDLTTYFPASGVKYIWITMTSAGTAVVVDDTITSLAALTLPVTANHLVGFVMLQFGQPIRWQNIKNVQGALDDVHDLLSAMHPDTLADDVVDGDVIVGNVTPKWSRLAISIPAANVRNVLGVDNGELRPSWKTALDATAPTTIAEGAVAAAGTSLVFSHRDHTHGAPATWAPTEIVCHNDEVVCYDDEVVFW